MTFRFTSAALGELREPMLQFEAKEQGLGSRFLAIVEGQCDGGNLNVNLLHRPTTSAQFCGQPSVFEGGDIIERPDREVTEVPFKQCLIEPAGRAGEHAIP